MSSNGRVVVLLPNENGLYVSIDKIKDDSIHFEFLSGNIDLGYYKSHINSTYPIVVSDSTKFYIINNEMSDKNLYINTEKEKVL